MTTLPDIAPQQLAGLCQRHGIQELALFGSMASGQADAGSDIDLLVTFEPHACPGFLTLARVQRDLEALFGRKVDLVPKGGLKPAIRDSVVATARILYASCASKSPRSSGTFPPHHRDYAAS